MTFRSVSFSRCYSLACFSASHTVGFCQSEDDDDDNGSSLGDASILFRGEAEYSSSILSGLERLAIEEEWSVEAGNLLSSSAGSLLGDKERAAIIKGGPWNVRSLSLASSNQSSIFRESPRLFDRLRSKADRILDRRTIFILPEVPHFKVGVDAAKLIGAMAEELFQRLRSQSENKFAFLREPGTGKKRSMMDLLLGELHTASVKTSLDKFKMEQGGPILLCGPTGSGKSYAAKFLARRRGKTDKLVEVNLSAVTDTMLESRMRGYHGGAFTGAEKKGRAGWFEEADQGVLFLDEFQSVGLPFQTQLLDVLNAVSDQVSVARIGKDHERQTYDVKVILAVNEDLHLLIDSGRLRRDLFFRMRKVVAFPSLRERLETDSSLLRVLLTTYRWKSFQEIDTDPSVASITLPTERLRCLFPVYTEQAISDLKSYSWPGNFRELERVAFDLFSECDSKNEAEIDDVAVRDALSAFQLASAKGRVRTGRDTGSPQSEILSAVERTLRRTKFVISKALPELKCYKLGSRPPLRRFLLENLEQLSEDVSNDASMRRFLKLP